PVARIQALPQERPGANVVAAEFPKRLLVLRERFEPRPLRRRSAPPEPGEEAVRHRSPGHRRDGPHPGEEPDLVQAPERTQMKQRGPKAAARKTKRPPLPLPSWKVRGLSHFPSSRSPRTALSHYRDPPMRGSVRYGALSCART